MASRCALIVDDETAMGRMLVEGLSEQGWTAEATTRVREALVLVDSGRFAVVVSDVEMPEGDGFELLGHIRVSRRPLPVILMSSFSTRETEARAREAGAFACLPKPFELTELVGLLERARQSG